MIQMTRQQYQDKYGTAPSISPTQTTQPTPAITNEPVKMTRQQYQSKYGSSPQTTQPPKTSLVEKVANAAPVAGGIIGGITGGLLGGTAGSVVPGAGTVAGGLAGSGAGTALGTFGGHAVKNTLLDLFGKQKQKPMEQLGQAAKQSAIAGVTDVATGGLLHGAGKIASPIFKSVGKVIDDIPLKSIRANPSQITKWTAQHGEDMANWMVKNKVLGENAIDIADSSASALQSEFDNLALNKNLTIPIRDLKKRFSDEILSLAGVTNGVKTEIVPTYNEKIAKDILGEWSNILKQTEQMGLTDADAVTPYMITSFRRAVDKAIPKNAFANPNIKNVALRLRKMMNDVVSEGVDARLIGEGDKNSLKRLGSELSKYYDFLDIASKQENLGRGSLLANLPRTIMGGGAGTVGALLGGVPGAVLGTTAGLAGEAALRSPEVLKSIYMGGKSASKAFPKIAKYGSKAFQRLPSAFATSLGQ